MEKELANETMAEEGQQKPKQEKKKKNKKKEKAVEEIVSEVRDSAENESDSEELEFWMPPVGDRWDFDDGGDRWGSGSELEESDEENDTGALSLCSQQRYFLFLNNLGSKFALYSLCYIYDVNL